MNILLWVLQLLAALLYGASGVMKVFMFDKVSEGVPSFGALPREAWMALGILELVCTVGLIVPAASQIGSPNEPDLLPSTTAELDRLSLRPREVALDGGFFPIGVAQALPDSQRVFIAGRQSAGSRRTDRRLARFRVGIEGRSSHLKRRYGLRRSRLKGHHGARTWTAWTILAYNLDTLAIRAA